jgi:hypothetical protein
VASAASSLRRKNLISSDDREATLTGQSLSKAEGCQLMAERSQKNTSRSPLRSAAPRSGAGLGLPLPPRSGPFFRFLPVLSGSKRSIPRLLRAVNGFRRVFLARPQTHTNLSTVVWKRASVARGPR